MFQRGYHERQEAALLRWSITLSLFAMPAFSMISMYAMALRIQQYGWSVDRVWASIMIGMMAIYALGYAYAALRGLSKQHAWLSAIAPTNTLAALLILLIIALSNSPILSPVRIAADSQVSRLLSAKIHADDFDFNYLRFDLGSVGTTQLERLKNITQHPEALRIQQLAKEALAKKKRWGKTNVSVKLENIHQHFQVFPKEAHLDQNLRQFLYEKRNSWTYKTCFKREQTCLILYIDLNQDTQHEAIIFLQGEQLLLSQQDETWHVIGTLTKKKHLTISQMKAMLEEETISTVFSPWKNLQVGQQLWGVKLH